MLGPWWLGRKRASWAIRLLAGGEESRKCLDEHWEADLVERQQEEEKTSHNGRAFYIRGDVEPHF